MTQLLQLDSIGKSFFGIPVLQDVSLTLAQGRVLGLVGENGAGKSTLMNILGGILRPDSGSIVLDGVRLQLTNAQEAADKGIAFVHQELNLFPNLTIAENLFIPNFPLRKLLGVPMLDKTGMRDRARQLLKLVGLDFSPDRPVADLNPGERQLVEIAKALNVKARILILDEPTTSLTARESERLFSLIGRLIEGDKSIIYISHALQDALRLCDDICILRDGRVVARGPKSEFTPHAMISFMTGKDLKELYPARSPRRFTDSVVDVRRLSQPGVVKDITFSVRKGEVLGIFGLMGAGRTELARIVFGLDGYSSGTVAIGKTLSRRATPRQRVRQRVAFLTEDRREEGLYMEGTVASNVATVALPMYSRIGFVDEKRLSANIAQIGRAVGLSQRALQMREVRSLSGGNQQKVVLSKWFLAKPEILILDEPTRGVDVGAKHEIYQLMNSFVADGGTILMISSEVEELFGMCDRVLVMRRGEICDELEQVEFDRRRILQSAFGARDPL